MYSLSHRRVVAISFHGAACTCQECQVKLSNYTKHKLISIFSFSIEHNHHLFKLNAIRCKRRTNKRRRENPIHEFICWNWRSAHRTHKWATLNRMEIIEMFSPFMLPAINSSAAVWIRQDVTPCQPACLSARLLARYSIIRAVMCGGKSDWEIFFVRDFFLRFVRFIEDRPALAHTAI